MANTEIREIPIDLVFGNPDQPRKQFNEKDLWELATSIRANGLIQPIKVTPKGERFMIVAGERRFRAHQLIDCPTIRCIVDEAITDVQVMIEAIVENGQRVDVHPLEEAVAYQACLDAGVTPDQLATKLGLQQVYRITERTSLLALLPDYQALFRSGNLTPTQAYEMAKLSPSGQTQLFRAIKSGKCQSMDVLRSMALTISDSERQDSFFGNDDKPSDAQRALAKSLESRFAKVALALRASTVDNEVIAVKKVDPTRAGTLADLLAAMQGDLRRIEQALRAHGDTVINFEREAA